MKETAIGTRVEKILIMILMAATAASTANAGMSSTPATKLLLKCSDCGATSFICRENSLTQEPSEHDCC